MVLLHLQCHIGAPLSYAVCHAACSSSSFLTAAPVSFTPLHSFLPRSTSLHYVRCFAIASVPGILQPLHKAFHSSLHSFFRKPRLQNSLRSIMFHSSFIQSVAFSPPAAIFFCARRPPHLGCVYLRLLLLMSYLHFAKQRNGALA
jgi:hypothetical protein